MMKALPCALLVAFVALWGAATPTYGQDGGQGAIEGIVVDSTSGETLPGASVLIVGTQRGTSTDASGSYSIEGLAAGDYTLRVSFIGYDAETRQVSVSEGDGITTADFALKQSGAELDEVVVVGYGTEQREDVTGAIASVSAADLEDDVGTSLDQALQGRVAGVSVQRNTGRPGGDVSIRVRGLGSLTGGAEPLYIIDGVPIDGDSNNGVTNPLATINPQDIQSIDILKDASATAIYGSRGSNGVVLITTKNGEAGQLDLSYNASVGMQSLPSQVGVLGLREYAQIRSEYAEVTGFNLSPELSQPGLLGNGTNWQDVLFRNAATTDHNLAVSGGNEDTQFRLSGGYTFQNGIAIESDFRRYSVNARINNQTNEWLNVGGSLNLSRTNQNLNVSQDDIVGLTIRQRPDIAPVTPTGSYGGPVGEQADGNFSLNNSYGLARLNTNRQGDFQAVGGAHVNIDFLDNLTLNNEVNASYNSSETDIYEPSYEFGVVVDESNNSVRSTSSSNYWQLRNYVNYIVRPRDDLGFDLTAGQEIQRTEYEGLTGSRQGFPGNSIQELPGGDAGTATNTSYAGGNSLWSYFGRLRIDYDNRYLLTSNFRADASSRFSEANRWGYFPSLAFAWKVQEESFMDDADFLNQLKVRAGWGQVGNESIGNYLYGDTYATIPTDFGVGVVAGVIGNPSIRWEATETFNAGVDLSLFERRLNLTVDAYNKEVTDLLLTVQLPGYAGTNGLGTGALGAPTDNIGALRNRGVEFALNTVNLTGDDSGFGWDTNVVFSLNRNEVTALNQENAFLDATTDFGSTLLTRTVVGEPAGQFYGYKVAGMFESAEELRMAERGEDGYALPEGNAIGQGENGVNGTFIGDLRFEDLNDDGVINGQDRTFIGDPTPDFQYGITNEFSYGDFDLSIFFNGNYGNDVFNQVRRDNENPSGGGLQYGNVLEETFDYARVGRIDENGSFRLENREIENPGTDIPRLTESDPNDNQRISDRFVEDGSYLRIQNVTLGYVLPNRLTERFSLQRLRVYASASNLYTLTGYSGYDPEIGEARSGDQYSSPNRALLSGVDFGRYPLPRTFTLGLNLTF